MGSGRPWRGARKDRETVVMEREAGYLVRYGSMGHVGIFAIDPPASFAPRRGQDVVIRTHRGEEVGELLVRVEASSPQADPGTALPRLVRPATSADLERARRCTTMRAERFALCGRIFHEEGWPLELIDVETLLDEDTTVIHYLGPRDLRLLLLRARFRSASGFDVVFEPAGLRPGSGPAVPDLVPGGGAARRCGIAPLRRRMRDDCRRGFRRPGCRTTDCRPPSGSHADRPITPARAAGSRSC